MACKLKARGCSLCKKSDNVALCQTVVICLYRMEEKGQRPSCYCCQGGRFSPLSSSLCDFHSFQGKDCCQAKISVWHICILSMIYTKAKERLLQDLKAPHRAARMVINSPALFTACTPMCTTSVKHGATKHLFHLQQVALPSTSNLL